MEGLYAAFMRIKASETKAEDGNLGSEIRYKSQGQMLVRAPHPSTKKIAHFKQVRQKQHHLCDFLFTSIF